MTLFWIVAVAISGNAVVWTPTEPLADAFGLWVCAYGLQINVLLLLVNLLVPVFPLDCSQILLNGLLLRGMEPVAAGRATAVISSGVAGCGLLIFGFLAGNLLTFFVLVFLGIEAYRLHMAVHSGPEALAVHPLFATPVRVDGEANGDEGGGGARP